MTGKELVFWKLRSMKLCSSLYGKGVIPWTLSVPATSMSTASTLPDIPVEQKQSDSLASLLSGFCVEQKQLQSSSTSSEQTATDAITALQVLGYSKKEVEQLDKIIERLLSVKE